MCKTENNIGYADLVKKHVALAKRVLDFERDEQAWNDLLNALLPVKTHEYDGNGIPLPADKVSAKYYEMVSRYCKGVTFEDFRIFCGYCLLSKNKYAIAYVIRRKSHFRDPYIVNCLQDAYKTFVRITQNEEVDLGSLRLDVLIEKWGDDVNNNHQLSFEAEEDVNEDVNNDNDDANNDLNVQDIQDDDGDDKKSIKRKHETNNNRYGDALDMLPEEIIHTIWKTNQKDLLCLLLRGRLCLKEEYVCPIIGCTVLNGVSHRYDRLWGKDYFKQYGQQLLEMYSASGINENSKIDEWLKFNASLMFEEINIPYKRVKSYYKCYFHLPYECLPFSEKYILVECVEATTELPVANARLSWNNLIVDIIDGIGEIQFDKWIEKINEDAGGEVVVEDIFENEKHELFPCLTNGLPPLRKINDSTFAKWHGKKMDKGQTGRFICDFGKGLAWLLNDKLEYSRYGAPRDASHLLLKPAPNEAWILFGNEYTSLDDTQKSWMLPSTGFLLPLEWRQVLGEEEIQKRSLPAGLHELSSRIIDGLGKEKTEFGHERNKRTVSYIQLFSVPFSRSWGIFLSERFFHDNVELSNLSVIGGKEENIASAFLTLIASLMYAQNNSYYIGLPVFASAKYCFDRNPETDKAYGLQKIGLLEKKMLIASEYGCSLFYVCQEQYKDACQLAQRQKLNYAIIPVTNENLADIGYSVAYGFFKGLNYRHQSRLKQVYDQAEKIERTRLIAKISKATNKYWDDKNAKYQSFVCICGKPGIGKSIIMSELQLKHNLHVTVGFACKAGEKDSCSNFIRSVSAQLCLQIPAYAKEVEKYWNGVDMSSVLCLSDAEQWFDQLVITPLKHLAIPLYKRHYILVDGLDEDDSNLIIELLTKKELAFPDNFSLVVSSRPLTKDVEDKLMYCFPNGVKIDLDSPGYSDERQNALKQYVITRFYSSNIRRRWEAFDFDDDYLWKKIVDKDTSFLYAKYVLDGIADGQYDIRKIGELPQGLYDHYHASFIYRFPAERYKDVRPFLKMLVENDRVSIEEAKAFLLKNGTEISLWRILKELRGYCLQDGDELFLSDVTLREWLKDEQKNPMFAI